MTEVRRDFDVETPERQWSDPNQSDPLPLVGYDGRNDGGLPISQGSSSDSQPLHSRDPLLNAADAEPGASNSTIGASQIMSEDRQAMPSYDGIEFASQYPDVEGTRPFNKSAADGANGVNIEPEEKRDEHNDQMHAERDGIIYHLIVTVKAPHTVNAVQQYAHRLCPESTILFLQNGMGMIDEVNRKIFPYEKDRPYYMVGILSHGLYGKGPFDIVHAGDGTIALGLLTEGKKYPASARYLLRTMTRTPVFVAVGFNPTDLLQQQLDKLALNAVVNPLTAILDCMNGQLLDSFYITRVVRLLLAEISVVFRSLPELKNVLNVNMRFDTARLESMVVRIAKLTGQNRSSMLQDVKAGRQTEIDYINGYIVRRGEELGIHCVTNYMIMQMVKAKDKMNEEERGGILPLQPSVPRK